MKHWIKKSLLTAAGASLILIGLGGCSYSGGHHRSTETSRAEFKGKMVERISSKLELNSDQKLKLTALGDKLTEQRAAMQGAKSTQNEQLKPVIQGNVFDKVMAQKLITEKTNAVTNKSPEVISAAADFFDSLTPIQQQKVRDFMSKSRHWGR
jgi:periplasmic protein CpxP/Spy